MEQFLSIFTDIDNGIVALYMIITLIVGYFSGTKINSFKEFAVAGKDYSVFVLVATIFATMVGGNSTVGNIAQVYSSGLLFLVVLFGQCLKSLVLSEIVTPGIKERFKNAISMGDLVEEIYGRNAKILTGVSCALSSLIVTSAQIFSIGSLFLYFFDVEFLHAVIIGYGIIIFYSTFGGLNAVIRTDVFQFFIMIVAIPMLASQGLKLVGGYSNLFESVDKAKIAFDNTQLIFEYGMLMLVFGFFFISPVVIQRVMIGPNNKTVVRSFRLTALVSACFLLVIALIALIGSVIDPAMNPNEVLFFLVKSLMPTGIKGVIIAGLIAAIMSTADSNLNVASISMYNDIVKVLWKKEIAAKNEIMIARAITFVFGLLTIFVAVNFKHVLSIILFSIYFWSPIILVPFYGIVFNRAISTKGFFICAIVGSISSLVWILYLNKILHVDGLVPTMLTVAFTFLILYASEGRKIFDDNNRIIKYNGK